MGFVVATIRVIRELRGNTVCTGGDALGPGGRPMIRHGSAKLDTITDMIRHDSRFGRFLTSPIGKVLLGAGVGGLVVAFANVQDPLVFVGGMVVGVIAVFALGQIR